MSNTQDPFASVPEQGTVAPPPGYQPPPPPAPGPAYAPAPGIGSIAVPSRAPKAKATWTIVLTGLVTLIGLVSAMTTSATVDDLKEQLADPENASAFQGTNVLSLLSFPITVGSFVLLALWMQAIRQSRVASGERVGGPPAVEWWGWFVPLGNYVLPFLGMRAITKGRVALGLLWAWWLPYCLYWVISWGTIVVPYTAIDYSTGKLTDPDALDVLVPLGWAGALLLVPAWIFLAIIVRTATKAEENR